MGVEASGFGAFVSNPAVEKEKAPDGARNEIVFAENYINSSAVPATIVAQPMNMMTGQRLRRRP
jgi:hypothetical protein